MLKTVQSKILSPDTSTLHKCQIYLTKTKYIIYIDKQYIFFESFSVFYKTWHMQSKSLIKLIS